MSQSFLIFSRMKGHTAFDMTHDFDKNNHFGQIHACCQALYYGGIR
jgi:hypothetical protein